MCPIFADQRLVSPESIAGVAGFADGVQSVELDPDVEVEGVGHVRADVGGAPSRNPHVVVVARLQMVSTSKSSTLVLSEGILLLVG